MTVMRTERRQWAWDRTDGRCYYCGRHLVPDDLLAGGIAASDGENLMQVDHGVARARGGTDARENLYPACPGCNAYKRHLTLEEFRFALGMKHGVMPHRFACDPPGSVVDRDFLIVASKGFRGSIRGPAS